METLLISSTEAAKDCIILLFSAVSYLGDDSLNNELKKKLFYKNKTFLLFF